MTVGIELTFHGPALYGLAGVFHLRTAWPG